MPKEPALGLDDFNELLIGLTEYLSEEDASSGPFVRLVVREDDAYRYCDFELLLKKDSEHEYVHQLRSLGHFIAEKQMPLVAVFVVGGGVFRPIAEDAHVAYEALLICGESAHGFRASAYAVKAADGSLTPFQLHLATHEELETNGRVARFVYEGVKAREAAMEQLSQQRN